MRKSFFLIVFLVLIAGIFAGCGNASPTNSNGPATESPYSPNITTTDTPSVSSNLVVIENYKFSPDVLTIKAGEAVEWTNKDSVIHTVKFDSFESPNLNQGGTYTYIFDTPGTFNYICGPHPSMKGKIIVE